MKTLFDLNPNFSTLPDCQLNLQEAWLPKREADDLFAALRKDVKWKLRQIFMFGRWVNQPRLTALLGDEGLRYSYTGSDWDTEPWHPMLLPIKQRIEREFGEQINSALCNLYRDGRDYCGWHTDFGKTDGPNPQIFSLSLGATRPFQIRHNTQSAYQLINMSLSHGDLLYMGGEMQKHWKHAVPKLANCKERINLTFRSVTGKTPK